MTAITAPDHDTVWTLAFPDGSNIVLTVDRAAFAAMPDDPENPGAALFSFADPATGAFVECSLMRVSIPAEGSTHGDESA